MADEALDPALQSDCRGRASGTGPVHGQIETSVPIALVGDVAAVLSDCRTNPGLEQFLDLFDNICVLGILFEVGIIGDMDTGSSPGDEQRRTADEMIEQGLEHERLEISPGNRRSRSYGNEIP